MINPTTDEESASGSVHGQLPSEQISESNLRVEEGEESMATVKFAGSVTIPPSAYDLARQEAEMDIIRDMLQGNNPSSLP